MADNTKHWLLSTENGLARPTEGLTVYAVAGTLNMEWDSIKIKRDLFLLGLEIKNTNSVCILYVFRVISHCVTTGCTSQSSWNSRPPKLCLSPESRRYSLVDKFPSHDQNQCRFCTYEILRNVNLFYGHSILWFWSSYLCHREIFCLPTGWRDLLPVLLT
jgi:hypothetical protein